MSMLIILYYTILHTLLCLSNIKKMLMVAKFASLASVCDFTL